ncbi:hypothetical protein E3V97_20590 [Pedobacter alluvionis]|uniref:Uncharacterized protein n=1 Tax=Pedobacter alluvionis TaxID=475253 RepID=A0ABY2HK68_9SPHI|nr:hypothetical protein E3V97_20590 [Pedobacter alluvionis]
MSISLVAFSCHPSSHHISHLTSHISHLTSHISHLTSHISHLTSQFPRKDKLLKPLFKPLLLYQIYILSKFSPK